MDAKSNKIDARDMVIRGMAKLPVDATLGDLRYQFDLICSIIEGVEDGIAGRVYSNDEVMREMRALVSQAKASAVPVGAI